MLTKILIANRGEIACRVIKSAKRLGIETVAVFSEADQDALHVRLADCAIPIGPAQVDKSYLNIDRIIAACQQSGAQAVHPGYGFLSENAAFANALAAAGILFIGPPVAAIEAMGDKIRSKRIAEDAGVNVIPGFNDTIVDAAHAVSLAREIGYPVMLKASAGGGGKGMRVAFDDEQCAEGFERARSEALSSFADDRIFVEKFIEQPRHIEIQLIGDQHGNIITLGERECSLQRRHQKVIEEAPSPFLDDETRAAMAGQARQLAKAVSYVSAGTVEFVVDAKRKFYFLEMNTRLQVEHPVTEKVVNLDLVEWMLRVADGDSLPTQYSVKTTGWAVEARIYAEDPQRNFLPSIGRLIRYQEPDEDRHTRIDSGVTEGGTVSMYYDPMLAKVICWDMHRDGAIHRLREALDRLVLRGVAYNGQFLAALLSDPDFVSGEMDTGLIGRRYPDGFCPPSPDEATRAQLLAIAVIAQHCQRARAQAISGQVHAPPATRPAYVWEVLLSGETYRLTSVATASGHDVTFAANSAIFTVEHSWEIGQLVFTASINGQTRVAQLEPKGLGYRLGSAQFVVDIVPLSPRAAQFHALMPVKPEPDLSRFLLSPMPGLLSEVLVAEGDSVDAGDPVCVVEAMKMENVLRASRSGRVVALLAAAGESLAVDQPILEYGE